MKKECVAMLLAGGQGSRLYVLTEDAAKPVVPFGGKYRIIDFPLSNCANSGIDAVGVLTQYRPLELNSYIGSGQPWDLDRAWGGVHILPPYVAGKTGVWYKGTANAIYQNIGFIELYDPEYVLVLSGDHIYKMDYSKLLEAHKEKRADCTIAVYEVPWNEAPRFGIMNASADGRIYEFDEKPQQPKSNQASMGIYVFTWAKLKKYLIADELDETSKNDFGADIIPKMLADGERLYSYRFKGYWKDVGTIESLWEANMDMLAGKDNLDLFDESWKIMYRNPVAPPHFTGENSKISHSLVTEGCEIDGEVNNSVLFTRAKVGKDARVDYSILMPGCVVEEGAVVEYAILAENTRVGKNARVGSAPSACEPEKWGVAVVGAGLSLENGEILPAKAMLGKDGVR